MQEAKKKLEESKHKDSLEDQRAARAELEKAKAELEEILRQLREEEIARTLAQLEARFRKMLEMQLAVLDSTRRLEALPPERRAAGNMTHSVALINACKPWHWRDKFPATNAPSPEVTRKAREKFGWLLDGNAR